MINRNQTTLLIGFCLATCALLCGCGSEAELDTSADEGSSASTPNVAALKKEPEQQLNAPKETKDPGKLTKKSIVSAYQPPFPDRDNLFVAPNRMGAGRSRHSGQLEEAVELLGFVNVDGQRVVLSIDGLVAPIAEGDTQHGVEVISIQPPAVVLQRGRQRWTATLEN